MNPTDEQQTALAMFATGDSMAIEAGAGTGKTTTLRLLAESTPRSGRYLAFNKAIVVESGEKMPANVRCSTAHSLAFASHGRPMADRLRSPRMRSDRLATLLGVPSFTVSYGQQNKTLQPGYLGSLVMRAIARFCQSADPEPARRHIPYVDGIDLPAPDGQRTWANNDQLRQFLAPALTKAWADLSSPSGQLPFSHDVYLKHYELSAPKIDADVVMFDEAQDASPVMESIVLQQQERSQLVFVGDSQQGIYEWRGAVNALGHIQDTGVGTAMLSQSFRFGPAIADAANVILELLGSPLILRGTDSIPSTIAPVAKPRALLCRSNAAAVRAVMNEQAGGGQPHLIGEGAEVLRFARAAQQLRDTGRTPHPDLACFESWGEVQDYVQQDPQGDDLRLLVGLVDDFGTDTIEEALARMPKEADASLVVSTAHKAKGREWPTVRLCDDFVEPGVTVSGDPTGERRLLYVAITRAQHTLDLSQVEWLADLLNPAPVTGFR